MVPGAHGLCRLHPLRGRGDLLQLRNRKGRPKRVRLRSTRRPSNQPRQARQNRRGGVPPHVARKTRALRFGWRWRRKRLRTLNPRPETAPHPKSRQARKSRRGARYCSDKARSAGRPQGHRQPHSFFVSSQIARPPLPRTSSIMWRVPPGPSPPSPFQRQTKSSPSAPKREAASSIQRLLRS